MRLRQIAIASYNLNEAERIINKELKIRTAFRDEEVEKYLGVYQNHTRVNSYKRMVLSLMVMVLPGLLKDLI